MLPEKSLLSAIGVITSEPSMARKSSVLDTRR